MTDEKNATPVVAPATVTLQAIPAMVEPTKVVVPAPAAGPVLSQAPAMTATDVKSVVDKPSSVVAPTVVGQK